MNVLLALVLTCGLTPQAADPLAEAVSAYEAGRFQEAFDHFSSALDDSPDAALLHNLGNCAYRLGRPARAVYYYRRALLRDPGSTELLFNLSLAEEQLGLDFGRDLASTVRTRVARVPLRTWVVLAGLLQSAGIGLWLASRGRRRLRLVAVACLVLGSLAAIRSSNMAWLSHPEGVVLEQDVGVRSDPHVTVSPSFSLGAGETVEVLEHSARWVHLRHAQGQGWAERSAIGLID